MWAVVLSLLAVGCASHPEPRGPLPSRAMRCTLRISQQRIFVDGYPSSRAAAVEYCKGSAGAVVVIDDSSTNVWDAKVRDMVLVEDEVTKAQWSATRSALEREGVRIYLRGSLCDAAGRFACWPRPTPVIRNPSMEPRRRIIDATPDQPVKRATPSK